MRSWCFVGALVGVACAGDPPAPSDAGPDVPTLDAHVDAPVDVGTDAGPTPDRVVRACEEVVLSGVAGTPIEGWPLIVGEARGTDLAFVAPAVARPTFLRIGDVLVRVDPRAESFEIPGLASDCGPFAHGVASGDPRSDGVTLWTRLTTTETSAELTWIVAEDPSLADEVARGTATANRDRDWTVHVDVEALEPARTYYYVFVAPDGSRSTVGRTRTAPVGSPDRVRFVVASCSSLFSGYFHAYREIAARDDLDFVLHLGDYLYDTVDPEERVRVPPSGDVEEPEDLAGHRRRHADYLNDPDLRLARRLHPWVTLWDNHDLLRSAPEYGGGVRAFREWTPTRPLAEGVPEDVLYRALRFGDLLELFVVDMYLFQRRDSLPAGSAPSVLGTTQFEWLTEGLRASTTRWRSLGMQKVFAEFTELSGWTDFPEARTQLVDFLRDEAIGDVLFLSGDSHITVYQDVVDDPASTTAPYDPTTGIGSVGAEFLPTSITRGNFDETLGPSNERLIASIREGFLEGFPHQVDLDLTRHGFGVVDVTRERIVAEVWYLPILDPIDVEAELGVAYAMRHGEQRWDRTPITTSLPRD